MKYWQSLRTRLVTAALLCLAMGALPLVQGGREAAEALERAERQSLALNLNRGWWTVMELAPAAAALARDWGAQGPAAAALTPQARLQAFDHWLQALQREVDRLHLLSGAVAGVGWRRTRPSRWIGW